MTSRATLLLACTLLGLAAASAATWVHAELVRHPNLSSVCDVSATVNCTEAYSSAYGKLGGRAGGRARRRVLRRPAPAPGERAAAARVPTRRTSAPTSFALSLPGVAFAAYLAMASWLVLHVVCLLCVTIDVATLGVCVIGALMTRFPFASLPGRARPRPRRRCWPGRPRSASALRFVAAAIALIALFPRARPRAGVRRRAARRPMFAAPPPAEAALPQSSQLDAYHGHRAAPDDPGRRPGRGGGDRQVQRLPVPAVRQHLRRPTSRSRRSGTRRRPARSSS